MYLDALEDDDTIRVGAEIVLGSLLLREGQAGVPRKPCLLMLSAGPQRLSHGLEVGSVVSTAGAPESTEKHGSPTE